MERNLSDNVKNIFRKRIVKYYSYGDTIEISNVIRNQSILVLPNKKYAVISTGEIKEMINKGDTRDINISSLKRTMRTLRRLIAHNFKGGIKELWVTLTYEETITDPNIIYNDFKIFIKKIRQYYGHVEYISVIEPHAKYGKFHLHVLLKSPKKLYIENSHLAELWGKGFTKTKRLTNKDSIANYVVSYLTNLDTSELSETNISETGKKSIVKGSRLCLYPKGLRIYRKSDGIVDPDEGTDSKKNLIEKYNLSSIPEYVGNYKIKNQDEDEILIIKEFYKKGLKQKSNNKKRYKNKPL